MSGLDLIRSKLDQYGFLVSVSVGPAIGERSPVPWPKGFSPIGLGLGRTELGKPFFVESPQLHFNVSHCIGAVAVVLAKAPVGVDIERIGRYQPGIVRRLFTDREQDYLYADQNLVEERYVELWTRKEATAKWSGQGGRQLDQVIEVLDEPRLVTSRLGRHTLSIHH